MDVTTLATTAMASHATQNSNNIQIAMLKQQNTQQQDIVNMLTESAQNVRAMTSSGVGNRLDVSA